MIAEEYLVELHQDAVKENIFLKAKAEKLQNAIDLLKEYFIAIYNEETESISFKGTPLSVKTESCRAICKILDCMDDWNEAMILIKEKDKK